MITERDTIKCEAIYDDTKTHRMLLERIWDKTKPLATVITIQPNCSTNIIFDTTTYLSINNVARLGNYGGIIMVNLYSKLTNKLDFKHNKPEELNHESNNEHILNAVSRSEVAIIAWGKGIESNKQITQRATEVINLLKEHKNKIKLISDGKKVGVHPLQPRARNSWKLVDFQYETDD